MAQHKSAEKRARGSKRKAARNTMAKSRLKTALKRLQTTIEKEVAQTELKKTVKLLDQLAAKGIIHKNNAANKKSRLTKAVSKLK